jgi:hypothetical protein
LFDALSLAPRIFSLLHAPRVSTEPEFEIDPDCPEFPPTGTLDVALKTAFDHAACAYRWLCGPRPSARDWQRIVHEVDRARRLYRARGWLDDPCSYHAHPTPLGDPNLVPRRSRGRSYLHLDFESGYAPHADEPGRERWLGYRANRTAHAWVLRHDDRPRPWMICIHGYGMGFPFIDFEAFPLRKLHDRLGFNVVIPVLPLHGARRVGRSSGERFLDGDILDTIHAEAQAMWELRRILTWIRAQQAESIGVYGLSLGGYTAALLASLESDLACVIAGIPAVDFLRLAMQHTRAATLERAMRAGMHWPHVAEALRVIAPLAMRPKVDRDRLFVFAGSCDRIVPPQQAIDLWQHWGRPHLSWYGGGHFLFRREIPVRRLLATAIERTMLEQATESAAA